jgi:hypothetical protein
MFFTLSVHLSHIVEILFLKSFPQRRSTILRIFNLKLHVPVPHSVSKLQVIEHVFWVKEK